MPTKKKNRSHRVTIRLTDEELRILRTTAKAFDGSVSKALRHLIHRPKRRK
jgi:hypothetical protein